MYFASIVIFWQILYKTKFNKQNYELYFFRILLNSAQKQYLASAISDYSLELMRWLSLVGSAVYWLLTHRGLFNWTNLRLALEGAAKLYYNMKSKSRYFS